MQGFKGEGAGELRVQECRVGCSGFGVKEIRSMGAEVMAYKNHVTFTSSLHRVRGSSICQHDWCSAIFVCGIGISRALVSGWGVKCLKTWLLKL